MIVRTKSAEFEMDYIEEIIAVKLVTCVINKEPCKKKIKIEKSKKQKQQQQKKTTKHGLIFFAFLFSGIPGDQFDIHRQSRGDVT